MSNSFKEKKIFWDTTKDPVEYPKEIKKIYFKLFLHHRKKFTNWIGLVSIKKFNNIHDLIKLPMSRDFYKSNLFKNILILLILKKKKNRKKIKKIIFSSSAIKNIYLTLSKNNNFEIIVKKEKNYIINILKSFIFSFIIFLTAKTFKEKKINKINKYIFFNTFLSCEDKIKDFVFYDLNKILKKKKIRNYYFIPNVLTSSKIFSLIKNLKYLSTKNYLFKEKFIYFSEFLFCFFSTLFQKNFFLNNLDYANLDCSLLIKEELKNKSNFYSEFQSRLILIFIKKLKDQKFILKKTIGRFENQSIDKAWFYGMRKYYPNIDNIGYQGFLYYPHLTNQSPTVYEDKLKLIPKKIIVTSKIAKVKRKEFYKNIKIILGPSLGGQSSYNKMNFSYDYKFALALCGIKSIDEKLISWINYLLAKDKDLKVTIKPHPTLSIKKISTLDLDKFNERYNIVHENIDKFLKKVQFLITSGPTGVIFESLIYSCKLLYLVLEPNDLLIFKNIPIREKNFVLIKDKFDLFNKIQMFKSKRLKKKKNNLKSLFFTKLNNKNIKLFY